MPRIIWNWNSEKRGGGNENEIETDFIFTENGSIYLCTAISVKLFGFLDLSAVQHGENELSKYLAGSD
ncbi:hypothetical protein [Lacrimispora sp.]|jgi:hypothetical protein|uniref:hypothetical protein n=1 Tax=Lacrimispora sp. TaxID=2719234 RepID=UPI0028A5DDB5|nr:hypothetical protein [Lacrimispora sp.]